MFQQLWGSSGVVLRFSLSLAQELNMVNATDEATVVATDDAEKGTDEEVETAGRLLDEELSRVKRAKMQGRWHHYASHDGRDPPPLDTDTVPSVGPGVGYQDPAVIHQPESEAADPAVVDGPAHPRAPVLDGPRASFESLGL